MDTVITTPTPKVADAAAKKTRTIKVPGANAPAKAAIKPKPVKAEAPKVERVNYHVAHGLDVNLYPGLSKFVNQDRKVAVRTDVTATADDVTDRQQKGLYALRKAYGNKAWTAKGFDNGILAHLLAAKLIEFSGGHVQTIEGHPKLTDGATPVTGKLTAAGMKYGIA